MAASRKQEKTRFTYADVPRDTLVVRGFCPG